MQNIFSPTAFCIRALRLYISAARLCIRAAGLYRRAAGMQLTTDEMPNFEIQIHKTHPNHKQNNNTINIYCRYYDIYSTEK